MPHKLKETLLGSNIFLNSIPALAGLIAYLSSYLIFKGEGRVLNLVILLLWLSPIAIIFWRNPKAKDPKLGLLGVLICALISPHLALQYGVAFENDFFRYIFEGKAISLGFNPYLNSPEQLMGSVPFEGFFRVGYPTLAGIYPPLTLGLFGLMGRLPLAIALTFFSLINGVVLYLTVNKLIPFLPSRMRLIGSSVLSFYLIREMIFQLHFELWPFYFILLALTSKSVLGRIGGTFLSFQLKFIAIIALFLELPFLKKKTIFLALSGVLASLVFFSELGLFKSTGMMAFKRSWYFSPGLLGWLYPLTESLLNFSQVKVVGILMGAFYLLAVFLRNKEKILKDRIYRIAVVLIVFFYISPVYNAWYAIWPASLLILIGDSRLGIWTLLLSPLCYGHFIFGNVIEITLVQAIIHAPPLIYLLRQLGLGSNHNQAIQYPMS